MEPSSFLRNSDRFIYRSINYSNNAIINQFKITKSKLILLVFLCLIVKNTNGQDLIQQKINYYISNAKLDSARTYIQTNLNKLDKKENKSALNYQLVKVLFMQSAYNDALKQAFSSLDAINKEDEKVKFNFMIGCIYSAITDRGKSVEYFDKVILHNQDPALNVQTHLLLSQLHLETGDTSQAMKAITEAYNISGTADVDKKMKSHVAMQYNFLNKNYDKAIHYAQMALNGEEYKYKNSYITCKFLILMAYYNLGNMKLVHYTSIFDSSHRMAEPLPQLSLFTSILVFTCSVRRVVRR